VAGLRRLATVGCVGGLGAACTSAPEPALEPAAEPATEAADVAEGEAELQALLEEELRWLVEDRRAVPGAVATVITPEGMATAAAGLASLEPERAMSTDAQLPVGSITKSVTATLVLQLIDEGQLQLDTLLGDWLPDVLPGADRITVEHLLSHTTGVIDDVDDAQWQALVLGPCHPYTLDDVLDVALALPTSPPGANHRYANVNYVALGLLAEAVTGDDLSSEVERRVLQPLGLKDTRFATDGDADAPVRGYAMPGSFPGVDAPRDVTCLFEEGAAGASGGLLATVTDVATFYGALLQGDLLEDDTLDRMRTPVRGDYGLGLSSQRTTCGFSRGHVGSVPGYTAVAANSTDGRHRLVLATNGVGNEFDILQASRRLYCAILP
jgi:D-alanyl-D-alanine carboxypeptidase